MEYKEALCSRFIRYTAFDTMSDQSLAGKVRPTTEGQEKMLLALSDEMRKLGLEVYYGEEKVLMGVLEGNGAEGSVAFMAHVDTASDVPGNGVRANLIKSYDGSPIVLDGVTIDPAEDPDLLKYVGSGIITSDGNTLLGSDDKAGVAIIMTALSYLSEHKEIHHPRVEVFFTPDEETGTGADRFPYERMRSSVCYTIDGEAEGEIEAECFNAASARIEIEGTASHPGSGRGRICNAAVAASHIAVMLPASQSPEATDGRYGYYAVSSIEGSMEKASITITLRDFDEDGLRNRIETVKAAARAVELLYSVMAEAAITMQYRNMGAMNAEHPEAMDAIRRSAERNGIAITEKIIRGGTDGARLAEKGIACPNIYTGGHNIHSRSEWIAVDAMESSLRLVLGIIEDMAL